MANRHEITFEDDYWEKGNSYDKDTGEFMSSYVRLKKFEGIKNTTIFDYEGYGLGTQKPDAGYFDQIEKWPYLPEFNLKEKWKREDWC
jgi:hypothetical protein